MKKLGKKRTTKAKKNKKSQTKIIRKKNKKPQINQQPDSVSTGEQTKVDKFDPLEIERLQREFFNSYFFDPKYSFEKIKKKLQVNSFIKRIFIVEDDANQVNQMIKFLDGLGTNNYIEEFEKGKFENLIRCIINEHKVSNCKKQEIKQGGEFKFSQSNDNKVYLLDINVDSANPKGFTIGIIDILLKPFEEKSGIDIIRIIRTVPEFSEKTILITLTAFESPHLHMLSYEAGADYIVVKRQGGHGISGSSYFTLFNLGMIIYIVFYFFFVIEKILNDKDFRDDKSMSITKFEKIFFHSLIPPILYPLYSDIKHFLLIPKENKKDVKDTINRTKEKYGFQ